MGAVTEMAFIGYDPKMKVYTYDAFASNGEHEHSTGTVSGGTWTWNADTDAGGKTIKGRYIMEESSPTSYSYHLDTSMDDGKTWATMMQGKATKVK